MGVVPGGLRYETHTLHVIKACALTLLSEMQSAYTLDENMVAASDLVRAGYFRSHSSGAIV